MASIVKRSRNKKPSYFVVYRVDGKQHWKLAGNRRSDAEKVKARIENDIHRGVHQELPEITFEEFVKKFLLFSKGKVRPKVFAYYESDSRLRLIPFFSDLKLKSIRSEHVEEYISSLLNEGKISEATTAKSLTILKMILRRAQAWGYIASTPAQFIKPPKVKRKEMDFLGAEEIRLLIRHTPESYRTLIMTACMTGLRQGELLGLKWGDIDFKNKSIFVKRTLQNGIFYDPKSRHGVRSIAMSETLSDALKEHQKRLSLFLQSNEHDLVFPNENGNPMDARNLVNRVFEPALRRAGLRRIRFHDLRHTFASLLISQGENIKYVQRVMGHHSAQITLDLYSHIYPDTERRAIERLDGVVFDGSSEETDYSNVALL